MSMKLLRYGLAAALTLLPPAALAAEQKANSIDELAKMYDVTSCKGCHTKIFTEWEKSFHATSLIGSPRTMATIASTIKDGLLKEYTHSGAKEVKDLTVEHMMICAKCHLPQLKDATDAVAREIAQAAIDGAAGDENARNQLAKVGINCLICHNQKALIHKWTDGEIDPTAVLRQQGRRASGRQIQEDAQERHHAGVDHVRPVPRTRPEFRAEGADPVRHPLRQLSPRLCALGRQRDLSGLPHEKRRSRSLHARIS
jgi:hypothetical protein